jgi:methionine-rich copper-binding protein CopC
MRKIWIVGLVLMLAASFSICAGQMMDSFGTPKKSPHWMNNTPSAGATLTSVPESISIDFDFDLGPGNNITIMLNDSDYGMGETTVTPDNRTMMRMMMPDAPDGIYNVTYKACWPDLTCHDGYFEFAINSTMTQ